MSKRVWLVSYGTRAEVFGTRREALRFATQHTGSVVFERVVEGGE